MAVAEVAMSIAYSGYFDYEPLFAEKTKDGDYVVIEGNRRLAAVRLLLDADLRRQLKATDLPTISATAAKKLSTLPVIVTKRELLWRYLGFKHVNGPSTWGSYAKAEYIAHVHNDYGIPLDEIAAQIGDYNSTVERMYRGLMLVEQAEDTKLFNRHDVAKTRFHFNYIYTCMDYPGVSKFIGTEKKKDVGARRPVPQNKVKNLAELMEWLYGHDSTGKKSLIQSQNPDLKTLDTVLQSDDGIKALRDGLPLEVARDISLGDAKLFRQSLQAAKGALQKALGTLTTGYDPMDKEPGALSQDIESLTQELIDGMHKKRMRSRKDQG